jgi:hypothetical protein
MLRPQILFASDSCQRSPDPPFSWRCCNRTLKLPIHQASFAQFNGLFFRPCDRALPPASWSPAVPVFDQQMSCPDFSFHSSSVHAYVGGAVILRHIGLQLFSVCVFWRIPSRLVCFHIKIVGQVFGVGMPNLPIGRQSRFRLHILENVADFP